MSDPQGLVSYPGLQTFTKAEYVLSQGSSPGKCTIELPQELVDGLEATGDLTIIRVPGPSSEWHPQHRAQTNQSRRDHGCAGGGSL